MFPLKKRVKLSSIPTENRWGAVRKHDVHTGVDLFAPDGTEVYAIEGGVVIDVSTFTGASIGLKWWCETMSCAVESKDKVILYGELYQPCVEVGETVKEGQVIGLIKTVLLKDKGRPMSMLHIEKYDHGYRGNPEVNYNIWDGWELDKDDNTKAGPKPEHLRNIEEVLEWESEDELDWE